MQRVRSRSWLVAALLFGSGFCALVYQVVWTRQLVTVFGVTAFAVSTVLVSFMGGMALGAALLGGLADRVRRPLRMFALLEAGIGAYALLLPLLLRAADAVYATGAAILPDDFVVRSVLRFVLCLLLLLPPTALMGATLPALGRGLLQHAGRFGRGLGILYFVNTLGSAFASAASVTVLPLLDFRKGKGLPIGRVNKRYSARIPVSGKESSTAEFAIAGKIPPGLELDDTGRLTGTLLKTGRYKIRVYAFSENGAPISKVFTIRVRA